MSKKIYSLINQRHFFTSAAAILLSVFMVTVVAYGASMMDTATVGAGTSTPGMAVSAKGGGLFEGPVGADFFYSTSTDTSWLLGGNFGLGTTTPGAKLAVHGGALVEDFVNASYFNATSTTATSTTRFGMLLATTSIIDGYSGRMALGTTTISSAANIAVAAVDPALTISGIGSAASATGTLYMAGGGASGGQIILKSSDGIRCLSLTATNGATLLDATPATPLGLTIKTISCPR